MAVQVVVGAQNPQMEQQILVEVLVVVEIMAQVDLVEVVVPAD